MTDHDNLPGNDGFPGCDAILQMPPAAVPQLIQDLSAQRQLSRLVLELNTDMLSGDAAAQDRARAVLAHLGFLDV